MLDVEGGSTGDGARIIQWNQTFSANQLWIFDLVPGTSDTYYIQSALSGKVITLSSSAPGAPDEALRVVRSIVSAQSTF